MDSALPALRQVLVGALTYLLPVTTGGGPAGNRRVSTILERAWHSRAFVGNAGVLALVVLPAGGWPHLAGWAAVLAGFGTFPALVIAALAGGRRRGRVRAGSAPPVAGQPGARPGRAAG